MPRSRRRLRHDRPVADDDHAAARLVLAEQDAQEGRFAAAAGADQRQELAGLGGDVDALQHAGVAVALLQPVDDDAAHLPLHRMRPGGDRVRKPHQQPVGDDGKQRDPGDIGQDHVHRQIAADQEDAVAEALGRGDGLGRDQEQPGRSERQAHAGDEARHDLRQHQPQHHGPAVAAERLRLGDQFGRQFHHAVGDVAHHDRRDADGDQRDLGRFAEAERDEQDRQQRQSAGSRRRR